MRFHSVKNRYKFFTAAFFLLVCMPNSDVALGCKLFGANGDVTEDSITIIAKDADLSPITGKQRIWYSPRAIHSEDDTLHFWHISIPQCSLTYKFIATNSALKDRTTNYGVNEYGLAIVSHIMHSWDDDNLETEYFDVRDYPALALARCQNAQEAINLFDELILPHGITAATYLIADPEELWLMETTGYNYVAKPIIDDVVSSRGCRYTIGTDWNDPGNRSNADILANAENHGCETDPLNFSECFSDYPPLGYDPDLLSLKERGDITVEDIRALTSARATVIGGVYETVSACVIPIRSDKDPAFFSFMWDSRANPKYGNVFLPLWMAITDTALPAHYTSWPPDDSLCAWNVFSEIVVDSTLRAIATPIWRALQTELFAEFDTVEEGMQVYLDSSNVSGLQEYINGYVYGELDSAYALAREIGELGGVPSCVSDLAITLSGEDLQLQWSTVTTDRLGHPLVVDLYRIYRGSEAYFELGSEPFDSTVDLFYVDDSGVVGDTLNHYYYAVIAVSSGKESESSRQVGEFDRHLDVGYSFVSWPLIVHDTAIQAVFADDMDTGCQLTGGYPAPNSDQIKYFDCVTEQWYMSWYKVGGPDTSNIWKGNLTTIDPDKGYWVIIQDGHPQVTLTMTGAVSDTHRVVPICPSSKCNYRGSCFAVACSLDGITGDDANLIGSGFTGGYPAPKSDKVRHFENGIFYTAWYKVGGPGPNGWKGNLFSLEPGNGCIIEVAGAFVNNQWVYGVPPEYSKCGKAVSGRKARVAPKREFSKTSPRALGARTYRSLDPERALPDRRTR